MASGTCSEKGQSQIGEVAGLVWHALADHGPLTAAKLAKEVDVPRDLVMQAVGWLAREDKLIIEDGPRSKVYALQPS